MSPLSLLLYRRLSTTFRVCGKVNMPTQVHGIEGRYATALFTAASKQNKVNAIEKEIQSLKQALQTNKQFKDLAMDPTLNPRIKASAIKNALKTFSLSAETQNFIVLLAENGRLIKLGDIIKSFEEIMKAHRGDLFIEVIVAEPLNKMHEDAINQVIKKFSMPGQKSMITYKVKPSIIGGLMMTIGDKHIDMSMLTQVKHLEQSLLQAAF